MREAAEGRAVPFERVRSARVRIEAVDGRTDAEGRGSTLYDAGPSQLIGRVVSRSDMLNSLSSSFPPRIAFCTKSFPVIRNKPRIVSLALAGTYSR